MWEKDFLGDSNPQALLDFFVESILHYAVVKSIVVSSCLSLSQTMSDTSEQDTFLDSSR